MLENIKELLAIIKKTAQKQGFDLGGLAIDFASCYGGYKLVYIMNPQGGELDLLSYRLKSKEFEAYLLGILRGLELKDFNKPKND